MIMMIKGLSLIAKFSLAAVYPMIILNIIASAVIGYYVYHNTKVTASVVTKDMQANKEDDKTEDTSVEIFEPIRLNVYELSLQTREALNSNDQVLSMLDALVMQQQQKLDIARLQRTGVEVFPVRGLQ